MEISFSPAKGPAVILSRRKLRSIQIQRGIAYVNLFWFVPFMAALLKLLGSYKCKNLKEVRKQYEAILEDLEDRPVILCSNHLTMIDSLLIIWFLNSFSVYLKDFSRFPWNVPELSNFGKNPLTRLMCYLGKCIYVQRDGSVHSRRQTLNQLQEILKLNETICIFPEGGRSRTGRVDIDSAVYGVGELIESKPEAAVVCLYLRGDEQKQHSFFPKRGDNFQLEICPLEVFSENKGRRAHRDYSLQILQQLKKMEDRYFDSRQ